MNTPRPGSPNLAKFSLLRALSGLRNRLIVTAALAALSVTAAFSFGVSAESFRNLLFGSAAGRIEPGKAVERTGGHESFAATAPNLTAAAIADGALEAARSGHTATRLGDGRILIVGGSGDTSAEIYDPATGISSSTGNTNVVRSGHAASVLGDGRVLVSGGGTSGAALASTEIYDPASGTFANGPAMTSARYGHTATTLANGNILIAGGGSNTGEIFDGTSFSAVTGEMTASRVNASAVLLADGRVFIAGGDGLSSAEIFNPADSTFTAAGNTMTLERARAHLRVLPDGKVQIIGGNNDASMEIYDPAIDTIGAYAHVIPSTDTCASLPAGVRASQTRSALFHPGHSDPIFDRTGHTVTELANNQAVAIGGTNAGTASNTITVFASSPATITTDKLDYAPGETVTFTGTGFQPGETVRVVIHEDPKPTTHTERNFEAVADASGSFIGNYAVEEHDLGVKFVVNAKGLTSLLNAQTTFTDARNLVLTFVGTGTGSVTVSPSTGTVIAPISCGGTGTNTSSQTVSSTCLPNITISDNGATVTFTAAAASGSTFGGWSAPVNLSSSSCAGTNNPCSAVLGGNPALTVTFNGNTGTTTTVGNAAATFGDASVNLSATVAPSTVNAGSVTFTVKQGVAMVGTATTDSTVVAGAASVSYALPAGTNAGSYTVEAVYNPGAGFNSSNGSATLAIGKAASTTVVTFEAGPYVYRGTAFTATATVTGAGGLNQPVPVVYSGDCLNVTVSNGCTATATYAESANHFGSNDNKSITITKAPVTATAGSGTATYDGGTKAPSPCAVTGTYKGDLTCANSPASVGPGVGTTPIAPVVSGTGLGNFAITPVNGSYTIDPAESVVNIVCPLSVVYSGAAQTPCTATVTGAGGLNFVVTPQYADNVTVGTATVVYFYAGDANHDASADIKNFQITAAPLTITAANRTKVFGQAVVFDNTAPSADFSVTGLLGSDSVTSITLASAGSGAGAAAGGHSIVPSLAVGTGLGNYLIGYVNGTLTVNAADTTTTVSASGAAYGGASQAQANMTTPRNGAAIEVVNGSIYVAGGFTGGHSTVVEAYDPVANTWTSKANRPSIQTNGTAGTVGGTMYVAGGTNSSFPINDLWAYTPSTDTWMSKAAMPTTRQTAAGGVINNLFYVAGGRNGGTKFTTLEVYDPVTNSWTTKAPMSFARGNMQGAVVAGKLYVFGGQDAAETYLANAEVYDPASNTWTTLTSMPTPRASHSVAAVGTSIYVIGGQTTGNGRLATVDVFDTVTGTWSAGSALTVARANTTAHTIGQAIHYIGGTTDAQINATEKNERYTPSTSSTFGDTVTFTATVAVNTPGAGTSSGTVFFFADGDFLPIGIGFVSGGTVSIVTSDLAAGPHNITASFASDSGNINDSDSSIHTHLVNKGDQTITFGALGDKTYGAAPFALSATGGASGNPITFASTTPAVCSATGANGATVTILAAGSCSITASQAGDANYNAADDVVQSFTVNQKTVTASFTAANKTYDGNTDATILTRAVTPADIVGSDVVTLLGGTATFDTKNIGIGKTVTGTGFTLGGAQAANYVLGTVATTTANITALHITGSFTAAGKIYDGNTVAAVLTRTLNGAIGGDVVSLSGGTAAFDTKGVGNGKTVTLTGATLAGSDSLNYVLDSVGTTTANITARDLTVTATGVNKVYDGTLDATVTLTDDRVAGDVFTASYLAATFLDKNVGTGKTVFVAGIAIAGTDAGNYNLTNPAGTATTTADITPRPLTVLATGINKVYDGTANAAVTLSDNRVSGDMFTASFASALFNDKHVGTGKPVSVSGISITGTDAGNYSLTATIASASAGITQLPISVNAVADTKTYDGTTASAGMPVFVTLATGDTGTATQVFDSRNAGARTLSVAGYTITDGNGGANYSVTTQTAAGAIDQRAITVSAVADTKIYDGTITSGETPAITVGSIAAGDTAGFTQTFDNRNAGTGKTLTAAGSVNDANLGANYIVTFVPVSTGVITPLAITVTAAADSREYDGTTNSAGVPTILPGLVGGDTSGFAQSFDNRNAGTGKTLTASGAVVDGNNGDNYSVTFVPVNTGTITARAITVSAVTDTKVYDGTTSSDETPTVTAGTIVGPDAGSFTQAYSDANAGSGKTLIPSGSVNDGNGGLNYAVNFVNNTTGVITRADAVIIVSGYNDVYDGAAHGATGTATGVESTPADLSSLLVLGAQFTNVPGGTANWTFNAANTNANYNSASGSVQIVISKADADIVVTPYSVTYDGLAHTSAGSAGGVLNEPLAGLDLAGTTHTDAGNYTDSWTFTDVTGNYNNDSDTVNNVIDKVLLTVTASSPTVTYGDAEPAITPSYAGFITGEDETDLTAQPACSTAYVQGSPVADSPYETSCINGASNNYAFDYVKGMVTVEQALLTVTASSHTITYGDAAPAVTPSYAGFVLLETSANLTTQPTCTTTYTQGSSVGSYPTNCSGGVAGNYAFDYVSGAVTVEKKTLVVAPNPQTITYGAADPAFTFTYSGFVLGDDDSDLTAQAICSVPGSSPHSAAGGPYTISCVAGADENYGFNVAATAVFTVNKAPLMITASSHTVTFSDAKPTITASYSGFVLGDDSGDLAPPPACDTAYFDGALVGSYPTTCSGAASGNYEIGYTPGTVNVITACSVFDGFLPPIGGSVETGNGGSYANPVRAFKLNSTIPVKFNATCFGVPLTTGVHTLQAAKYSNSVDSDPAIDATPTDGATVGNQFRLSGSEWHFNMNTKGLGNSGQGTWLLKAQLFDGSVHTVWISIKK